MFCCPFLWNFLFDFIFIITLSILVLAIFRAQTEISTDKSGFLTLTTVVRATGLGALASDKLYNCLWSWHFVQLAPFISQILHFLHQLLCIFIFKGAMVKTQQTCHLIWNRSDILCPPLNKLIVASWHHLERRSTTCSCNMDAAPSHLNLR